MRHTVRHVRPLTEATRGLPLSATGSLWDCKTEVTIQVCMILHHVAASLENAYALFPSTLLRLLIELGPKCDFSGFCS